MVTVYIKGMRKYGTKSYENESYLLGKAKAGIVHTEDGIILTFTDMKLSKKLEGIFNK